MTKIQNKIQHVLTSEVKIPVQVLQLLGFIKALDCKTRQLRIPRAWSMAAFVLALFYFLVQTVSAPIPISGDGTEYVTMSQSWAHHASPEARPSDFAGTAHATSIQKGLNVAGGYYQARNGGFYSYHFWFYSLLCAPLTLLLQHTNGNVTAACPATDVILLSTAIGSILFFSALTFRQKLVFTTLLLVSPVWWYLRGTGVEIFSLSFVVMALSALSCKRFPLATLFAALASLQNPPLLVFVLYLLVLSATTKNARTIAKSLLASSLSLLPFAFYQLRFGVPSVISALGMASLRFVSTERMVSAFIDLNQGFLPYVPGVLIGSIVALFLSCCRQKWENVLLAAAIFGIVALCATTVNWNSGTFGMMRYLVWVLPLLVWFIATASHYEGRLAQLAIIGVVIWHLGIVQSDYPDYLHFAPAARDAMANYPGYPVEPEVRAERASHHQPDFISNPHSHRFLTPTPVMSGSL